MFIVSEMHKEARKEANLTQEQLAEKAGTKKSYISKIENAKGNIQLSTLIRIFEKGLNRKIGLTFLQTQFSKVPFLPVKGLVTFIVTGPNNPEGSRGESFVQQESVVNV